MQSLVQVMVPHNLVFDTAGSVISNVLSAPDKMTASSERRSSPDAGSLLAMSSIYLIRSFVTSMTAYYDVDNLRCVSSTSALINF